MCSARWCDWSAVIDPTVALAVKREVCIHTSRRHCGSDLSPARSPLPLRTHPLPRTHPHSRSYETSCRNYLIVRRRGRTVCAGQSETRGGSGRERGYVCHRESRSEHARDRSIGSDRDRAVRKRLFARRESHPPRLPAAPPAFGDPTDDRRYCLVATNTSRADSRAPRRDSIMGATPPKTRIRHVTATRLAERAVSVVAIGP